VIDSRSQRFARGLFAGLPPKYDFLPEVLSLGQYGCWRRALVERLTANRPHTVLDVATGTAGVAIAVAQRSDARLIGVDITEAMLRRGRANVERAGMQDRVRLVLAGAEDLPFPDEAFDAVSFTYLLRYVADPAAALRELARVLKPGGWLAGLDFFVPAAAFWRACWKVYTRWLLPLGARLGGPAWHRVGCFLGPNIEAHYRQYPLEWLVRAWEQAGVRAVQTRVMSLGGGLLMWGQRADG
jgi:demethylmenaquinone methyltransferase/2-methoxy-6-polyprenyl-1,4-benzoquinol methylase